MEVSFRDGAAKATPIIAGAGIVPPCGSNNIRRIHRARFHLAATSGLNDITLNDGRVTKTPQLPFAMDGRRLGLRDDPPELGEHTEELLHSAGYDEAQIASLIAEGVVRVQPI